MLSVIGSRRVRIRVQESALPEAGPGGKTVWLGLFDGPLAVTFTREEARWLAGRLACEEARVTSA